MKNINYYNEINDVLKSRLISEASKLYGGAKPDYINLIDPNLKSEMIFNSIEKYLEVNMYSKDEVLRILKELELFIDSFGNYELRLVQDRIDLTNHFEKENEYFELKNEYKKTFDSIIDIRKQLSNKFRVKCQNLINPKLTTKKNQLKISQIALKYVYEGSHITRENSNKIVKKFGHTSGDKLYQKYCHYSSTANRKGEPEQCTLKKLNNKIQLIESVIELLPTNKQSKAKDEVSILKTIKENDYL